MAVIRTVTFGDGTPITITDWGDYPLWSRGQMAALQTTDVPLFQYIEGQQVPGGVVAVGGTAIDTNMPGPGQLPLGHQMLIYSIQAIFDEGNSDSAGAVTQCDTVGEGIAKWNNIVTNTLFRLKVEQSKSYAEGLLTHFPAGGGVHMVKTDTMYSSSAGMTPSPTPDVWSAYIVQNGNPTWEAARRLAMPIHIGALESFRGVLSFPRGALTAPESPDKEWGCTIRLTGPRQRPAG